MRCGGVRLGSQNPFPVGTTGVRPHPPDTARSTRTLGRPSRATRRRSRRRPPGVAAAPARTRPLRPDAGPAGETPSGPRSTPGRAGAAARDACHGRRPVPSGEARPVPPLLRNALCEPRRTTPLLTAPHTAPGQRVSADIAPTGRQCECSSMPVRSYAGARAGVDSGEEVAGTAAPTSQRPRIRTTAAIDHPDHRSASRSTRRPRTFSAESDQRGSRAQDQRPNRLSTDPTCPQAQPAAGAPPAPDARLPTPTVRNHDWRGRRCGTGARDTGQTVLNKAADLRCETPAGFSPGDCEEAGVCRRFSQSTAPDSPQ